MVLTLYMDSFSQPCRTLEIFCKMEGIEYEEHFISFMTGECRSPEYMKINPMGKIPAMAENGWILTESTAILRYLCTTRNISDPWYPTDVYKRARVDEFLAWQHIAIRATGCTLCHAVLVEKIEDIDFKSLPRKCQEFEKGLDGMENYFLKEHEFVAGSEMTIADVFAATEIYQPLAFGYDVTKGRPRVAAWIQRVKNKTQPYFDQTHKSLLEVGSKYKQNYDELLEKS